MLRVGFAVLVMAIAGTTPALATSEQTNQKSRRGVDELARVPVVFGGERRGRSTFDPNVMCGGQAAAAGVL